MGRGGSKKRDLLPVAAAETVLDAGCCPQCLRSDSRPRRSTPLGEICACCDAGVEWIEEGSDADEPVMPVDRSTDDYYCPRCHEDLMVHDYSIWRCPGCNARLQANVDQLRRSASFAFNTDDDDDDAGDDNGDDDAADTDDDADDFYQDSGDRPW